MEKLVDNLFNFELAAYNGAHTPVSLTVSWLGLTAAVGIGLAAK